MNRRNLAITALLAILIVAAAGVMIWSRRDTHDAHSRAASQGTLYYCPMHPSVTSAKPGNCPICGMKLVKRTSSPAADVASQIDRSGPVDPSLATIALSPGQRVMANVRTTRVASASEAGGLITTGRVSFDERRLAQVTSYTAGRIERLFVNFTGDSVVRGNAVAAIYSPDLYATQQEYLLALANRDRMRRAGFAGARSASDDLADSSRRKLLLLGMGAGQIEQLAATGRPFYSTTIVSPVSGIVTKKLVVPQQYVMQGQPLFEIADLSNVWVEADVYAQDLLRVEIGQRAMISSPALPGVELSGLVSFIAPVVGDETRTTRVRIELPNRNLQLKPDMYVSVRFIGGAGRPILTVPRGAVIDRGRRQFVWVELSPGSYAPREVSIGSRRGERTQIISGLREGETIVTDGGFLLDSEAQLRSMGRDDHAGKHATEASRP